MTDKEALKEYIPAKRELRDLQARIEKPDIPLHRPLERADHIALTKWRQIIERSKAKPLRVISQAERAVALIQDEEQKMLLELIYFDGAPVYSVAEAMGYCERSIHYHLKEALTLIEQQEAARAESRAAAGE